VPKTFWGKFSFGIVAVIFLQSILFMVILFENGFESMIRFIALYIAPLGIVIGIIGFIKEKDYGKLIPTITLAINAIFIVLFFLILFGYQFGG
jgi:hypothetical protein